MKLTENPIFITQKRIVHRGGVLAVILIAALVGFCLLLGLWANLQTRFVALEVENPMSPQEAGRAFYIWVIIIEALILILGGFMRIARVLGDDRKAGLWDSNRMTPLSPSALTVGYWFGPPLREFYMAAVLAGFGLLITLISGLPVSVWLGTQTLMASTALFFGLLAVLAGMAFQKSQGALIILAFVLAMPFSAIAPRRMLTNFLMPIFGMGHFLSDPSKPDYTEDGQWHRSPEVFGLPVHPLILSLILQLVIGIFVWRALNRKTANPFGPLLRRGEAVWLFIILSVSQHALLWDAWHGQFPLVDGHIGSERGSDTQMLLPMVLACTLFAGVALLGFVSPRPEQMRVESMRLGFKNLGAVVSRSALPLALVLAGITGACLATHFVAAASDSWRAFAVTVINFTEIFVFFALLLEFCTLRHRRRSIGFMVLWLFLVCGVPFILAAVFSSSSFAIFSLLSPGCCALANDGDLNWPLVYLAEGVHLVIIIVLFFGWRRQWLLLLQKAQ